MVRALPLLAIGVVLTADRATASANTCSELSASHNHGDQYVVVTRNENSQRAAACQCARATSDWASFFNSRSAFVYSFDLYVGGGNGADGMSFSFVRSCNTVNGVAEEGSGYRFSLAFDSNRNHGGDPHDYAIFIDRRKVASRTGRGCWRFAGWLRVTVAISAPAGQRLNARNHKTVDISFSGRCHGFSTSATFALDGELRDQFAGRTGGLRDYHLVRNMTVDRATYSCGAGQYGSGDSCVSCPVGKYQDGTGATSCKLCEAGRFQPHMRGASASSCKACGAGLYNDRRGQASCKSCAKGTHSREPGRSECEACAAGSFADAAGMSSCTSCEKGRYNPFPGRESCGPCPAGQISTAPGGVACTVCGKGKRAHSDNVRCVDCEAGRYVDDEDGHDACKACAKGRSGPVAGLTEACIPCSAGHFQASEGATACAPCPAGMFAGAEGRPSCESCSPGTYAAAAGSSACVKCARGRHAAAGGASGCLDCGEGAYSSSEGGSACSPCPAGRFSDAGAHESCDLCPAGRYAGQSGLRLCRACAAGRFQGEGGQRTCSPCPDGEASGPAAVSCTACGPGRYAADNACKRCPRGRFQRSKGASSCSSCVAGRFSDAAGADRCADCGAGRFSGSGAVSCSPCTAGRYQDGGASPGCKACEAGRFGKDRARTMQCVACAAGRTSGAGALSCEPCAAGTFGVRNGCSPCAQGKFSSTGAVECNDCSAGTFAAEEGASTCEACSRGRHANSKGARGCIACVAGRYSAAVGAAQCTSCRRGQYVAADGATEADLCPPGTYQDATRQTSCKPCAAGRFAPARGAEECAACAAGSVSSEAAASCSPCGSGTRANSERSACEECPRGTHGEAGGVRCVDCAAGAFQDRPGQSACTGCPKGKYGPQPRLLACLECGAGKFQDRAGAVACKLCAKGLHAGGAASEGCELCPSGKFTGSEGAQSCSLCRPGRHAPSSGASDCSDCAAGKVQGQAGGRSCSDCEAGTFQDRVAQTACKLCWAGTASDRAGAIACEDCAPGSFSDAGGATACVACEAGKVQPSAGARSCADCDIGRYAPGKGMGACVACPPGHDADSCRNCGPGKSQGFDGRDVVCEDCAVGRHQKGSGQDSCAPCPPGRFTDVEGWAQDCKPCAAGRANPRSGQGFCIDCASGTASPAGGAAVCERCELGKYAPAAGSTVCVECAAGRVAPNAGRVHCAPCQPGRAQGLSGRSSCEACTAGRFSDVAGSARCTLCPEGRFSDMVGTVECEACGEGTYQGVAGEAACDTCAAGYYATGAAQECLPCPPGRVGSASGGDGSASCSGAAPPGTYTEEGSFEVIPCPAGTFSASPGSADARCEGPCAAGHFCPDPKSGAHGLLKPGLYAGSSTAGPPHLACHDGMFSDEGATECSPCEEGFYCPKGAPVPRAAMRPCGDASEAAHFCPAGSAAPRRVRPGFYAAGGAPGRRIAERPCEAGHFCVAGVRRPCPAGTFGRAFGLSSSSCSGRCQAGYFCPAASTSATAEPCGGAHVYCPPGSGEPRSVPDGWYSTPAHAADAATRTGARQCSLAQVCEAGTVRDYFSWQSLPDSQAFDERDAPGAAAGAVSARCAAPGCSFTYALLSTDYMAHAVVEMDFEEAAALLRNGAGDTAPRFHSSAGRGPTPSSARFAGSRALRLGAGEHVTVRDLQMAMSPLSVHAAFARSGLAERTGVLSLATRAHGQVHLDLSASAAQVTTRGGVHECALPSAAAPRDFVSAALVLSDESVRLYVDGAKVIDAPDSVASAAARATTLALGESGTAPRDFDGAIDEVIVLRAALTEPEVLDLATAGRRRAFADCTKAVAELSLIRVNETSGAVELRESVDHELCSTFTATVAALDDDDPGRRIEGLARFAVADSGEAPAFDSSSYALTVSEYAPAGTMVGDAFGPLVRDPDALDSLAFYISDAADGRRGVFGIERCGGQVFVLRDDAIFHGADPSFALEVAVTDSHGLSATANVTVHVLNVNDAPTATVAAPFEVRENQPPGELVVGRIESSDLDGDRLLFSIVGGEGGDRFHMDAGSGNLTTTAALDFEELRSYELRVLVAEDRGDALAPLSVEVIVPVEVLDQNDSPVIADLGEASFEVEEGSPPGTLVLALDVFDEDGDSDFTYELAQADAAFEIDADGTIFTAAGFTFDFEDLPFGQEAHYAATATVSDGRGGVDSRAFTVSVRDRNEPPVIEGGRSFEAYESREPRTEVLGSLAVRDADTYANQTLYFRVDSDLFSVQENGAGGVDLLSSDAAFDFEGVQEYAVVLTVVDDGLPSSSAQAVLTVRVLDVNEAPVLAPLQGEGVLEEVPSDGDTVRAIGSSDGTALGFIASDPDGDDCAIFIRRSEPPRAKDYFRVNPNDGRLEVDGGALERLGLEMLDFEAPARPDGALLLYMAANDTAGLTSEELAVVVHIEDVNEAPVARDSVVSVGENAGPSAQLLPQLTASDVDGDRLTYHISRHDYRDALGKIVVDMDEAAGCLVTVKSLSGLASRNLTITFFVSDGELVSEEATATVVVSDANFAPGLALPSEPLSVREGDPPGSVIGTLRASDVDERDTHRFSLAPRSADAPFLVDAATGAIAVRSGASFDHESVPSYSFAVEVQDQLGAVGEGIVEVLVRDAPEAPVFPRGLPTLYVPEDAVHGRVISTAIAARDADAADRGALSYSVVGGDDRAPERIRIGVATSSELRDNQTFAVITFAGGSLDYETRQHSGFVFRLRAEDTEGLAAEAELTLHVQDANEPPVPSAPAFSFSVLENATYRRSLGREIGKLGGLDPDGDEVEFLVMLPEDARPNFVVDPARASIAERSLFASFDSAFDYERSRAHDFDVLVRERGVAGAYSTTVSVHIDVVDVHDGRIDRRTHQNGTLVGLQDLATAGGTWVYFAASPGQLVGPVDGSLSAATAVHATYGNALGGAADAESPRCEILAPGRRFRCLTAPGVGQNQSWTITVAAPGTQSWSYFAPSTTSYRAPVICSVATADGGDLATAGGSRIRIGGSHFGPARRDAVQAYYVAGGGRLPCSAARVTVADTEIECVVGEGVGKDVAFLVTTGDGPDEQASAPFTSGLAYAPPVIVGVSSSASTLDTRGGDEVTVAGANLGRSARPSDLALRYGPVTDLLGPLPCTVASTVDPRKFALECRAPSRLSIHGYGVHLLRVGAGARSRSVPLVPEPAAGRAPGGSGLLLTVAVGERGAALLSGVAGGSGAAALHYGRAESLRFQVARGCTMAVAHQEVRCVSAPGVGVDLIFALSVLGTWTQAFVPDAAVSYTPPAVYAVAGSQDMKTRGGDAFTVSGDYFGPESASRGMLEVRYGRPGTPRDAWYEATDCQRVRESVQTTIVCTSAPGTGAGHDVVVIVAGQASEALAAAAGYARPIVQRFAPDWNPEVGAATPGGERIVVHGSNFGPKERFALDEVSYGIGGDGFGSYARRFSICNARAACAALCSVVESHMAIACRTAEGAGRHLQWTVVVDGLRSQSPTTAYARPSISALRGPVSRASLSGGELVTLLGANFGPHDRSDGRDARIFGGNATDFLDSVTYGTAGVGYDVTRRCLVLGHGGIECSTLPGIGAKLKWRVTIAGQSSPVSEAAFSYASPRITGVEPSSGSTAGGSVHRIRGTDLGLGLPEVRVRLLFGGRSLPYEAAVSGTEQALSFVLPELVDDVAWDKVVLTIGDLVRGSLITEVSNAVNFTYDSPRILAVSNTADVARPPCRSGEAATKVILRGRNFGRFSSEVLGRVFVNGTAVPREDVVGWSHSVVEVLTCVLPGRVFVRLGAKDSNAVNYAERSPKLWSSDERFPRQLSGFPTSAGADGVEIDLLGQDLGASASRLAISYGRFPCTPVEGSLREIEGRGELSNPELFDAARANGVVLQAVKCRLADGTGALHELSVRRDRSPPAATEGFGGSARELKISYAPPEITAVGPDGATSLSTYRQAITVTGRNFGRGAAAATVYVARDAPGPGNTFAVNVSSVDHRRIVATIEEGEGASRRVALDVDGQGAAYSPVGFAKPRVAAMRPAAPATAGATITLSGSNFGIDQECEVLPVAATCTVVGVDAEHRSVRAQLSAGQGANEIRITSGGQASEPIAFRYQAPEISGVSATAIPTAGGEALTLRGRNFGPGAEHHSYVSLSGPGLRLESAVPFVPAPSEEFLLPALEWGDGEIVLSSPTGQADGPLTVAVYTCSEALGLGGAAPAASVRARISARCTSARIAEVLRFRDPRLDTIAHLDRGSIQSPYTFDGPRANCSRASKGGCGLGTGGGYGVRIFGRDLGLSVEDNFRLAFGGVAFTYRAGVVCAADGDAASSRLFAVEDHSVVRLCSVPPGVGAGHAISLARGGVQSNSVLFSYDPPFVEYISPDRPNAGHGLARATIEVRGRNFGATVGAAGEARVFIGGLPCLGVPRGDVAYGHPHLACDAPSCTRRHVWRDDDGLEGSEDPYLACQMPLVPVGDHEVVVSVAGQNATYERPVRAACVTGYYGQRAGTIYPFQDVRARPARRETYDLSLAAWSSGAGPTGPLEAQRRAVLRALLDQEARKALLASGPDSAASVSLEEARAHGAAIVGRSANFLLSRPGANLNFPCTPCTDQQRRCRDELYDAVAGAFSDASCEALPACGSLLAKAEDLGLPFDVPFDCSAVTTQDEYCAPCPPGATCRPSDPVPMEPVADEGFYRVLTERAAGDCSDGREHRALCYSVVPCLPADACEGGNVCKKGYTGTRCAECCDVLHQHLRDATKGAVTDARGKPIENPECYGDDGKAYRYYRLNGECAPCPANLVLIVVAALSALVVCGTLGWWLRARKVNLGILGIGVDYFQVLSILATTRVEWPPLVARVYLALSFFNLNVNIAPPECAFRVTYEKKWMAVELSPLAIVAACLLVHGARSAQKRLFRKDGHRNLPRRLRRERRGAHVPRLVGTSLAGFYFAYLQVSQNTLEVFNCSEIVSEEGVSDGRQYMQAAPDEPCYEPGSTQSRLLPFAALFFCAYSLGYPLLVSYILLAPPNMRRAKLDQLDRAMNPHDDEGAGGVGGAGGGGGVRGTEALAAWKERRRQLGIYEFRKKYGKLYCQFKPDGWFWILVVLARKFLVVTCALLFRENPTFQMCMILLVMFAAFGLQVRSRPFMSSSEREEVLRLAKLDARHAPFVEEIERARLAAAAARPQHRRRLALGDGSVAARAAAARAAARAARFALNWNTVETALLAAAVLVNLFGIMFNSQYLEPGSGSYGSLGLVTLLVVGSSLAYYGLVVWAEIVGVLCPALQLPAWCMGCVHEGDGRAPRRDRRESLSEISAAVGGAVFHNPMLADGGRQQSPAPRREEAASATGEGGAATRKRGGGEATGGVGTPEAR